MSENFEAEQNTDGANPDVRELSEVPAVEVISRAAVMLMSSAAEKLGLSDADPSSSPYLDLDEARRVITALAGPLLGEWAGWRRWRRCSTRRRRRSAIRNRITDTAEA